MRILNVIMDILIGAVFIINVCFKQYFKIYAYGILPIIFLVSVFNIYACINDNLNMYINDHLRMYTSDYALI